MVWKGKKADYEGFGKDIKKGLSKAELLKKYNIKTNSTYRTYLYRARALGILDKESLPGQPIKKDKTENQKGRKPEIWKTSKPDSQKLEKVTFQLPGNLVKRIKYKAIDQDKKISWVVRETLERHI